MSDVENSANKDKRKHLRINAAHPARIKTDGIDFFSCFIKDFCRTGFFVEFDLESNPNKAMILSSLDVSLDASIDFSIAGRLGEKYTISGTIVRLTENGAGLFASDMPLNAYEALYMMNVEATDLLDQDLQLSDIAASRLRQSCHESFDTYIDKSTVQFFENLETLLVQEGNSASFTDRGAYTYALNLIKEKKASFCADYKASLNKHLLIAEKGQEIEKSALDAGLNELSLVDKDDFELWLTVSKMVSKIENKFTLALSKIAKRYQLLAEINIDRKTNPFGPEILCRELSNQIEKLNLSSPVDSLVNNQIVEHMFKTLPEFYDEIIANLIPLSSLVATKENAISKPRNTSRGQTEPEKPGELNDPIEETEKASSFDSVDSNVPSPEEYLELPGSQNQSGVSSIQSKQTQTDISPADSGTVSNDAVNTNGSGINHSASAANNGANESNNGTPDSRYGEISQLSQQILSQGDSDIPLVPISSPASQVHPSIGSSGGEGLHSAANALSASSGYSGASSVASFLSNQAPGFPQKGIPESIGSRYSGLSLVSRLQNTSSLISRDSSSAYVSADIQNNPPQIFTRGSEVGTEFLQQVSELPNYSARKAEKGDGRLQVALSQQIESLPPSDRIQAQNLVQFIDRTTEDFSSESQLAALINQLDTTLLKLALKDPEFLDSPDHDARQVVDILGEYHISENDDGRFLDDTVHHFLELQVDRVRERSDEDPNVYNEAKTTMVPVLEKARRAREIRVSSFQQSAEGRDRVRSARNRVNEGLNRILSERSVPEVIVHLLNSAWRQAINLLAIRHNSDQVVEAQLDILDLLIRHYDGAEVEWPVLVDQMMLLRETLTELCISTSDFEGLFDHLWKASLSDNPQSLSKIFVGTLETNPGVNIAADVLQFTQQLVLGDWWHIDLAAEQSSRSDEQDSNKSSDKDLKPLCMQLIWISESTERFAFVNRSATRKKEYKIEDLFKLFNAGQLKPMGINSPIFERIENRLLDEEYEKVSKQSVVNSITDLPNRAGFMQSLASSSLHSVDSHALLICEFDQFRMINNNSGTEATEQLYRELSKKLLETLDEQDLLASFKDDTFAILKHDCDLSGAEQTAKTLVDNLKDFRFDYKDKSYTIGLNIGFGEFHPSIQLSSDAVRKVDSACLAAKDLGRNEVKAYTDSDVKLHEEISVMDWAGRLDQIFIDDSLYLRCQMVLPISSDPEALPYYEILLGIQDADTGVEFQPGWFVSAIERYGRTSDLDKWVVENAFNWIEENLDAFEQSGGFALNLSAISLGDDEVLEFLIENLKKTSCSPEKICFEITETVAISNYALARRFIERIRQFGCQFCIDDFGSGFASYSYLKNLNTQILKIDGSFVRDISKNEDDLRIVESMRDIAVSLGMKTVAESVENPATLSKLKKMGIDYAQGYTIHRPEPLRDVIF